MRLGFGRPVIARATAVVVGVAGGWGALLAPTVRAATPSANVAVTPPDLRGYQQPWLAISPTNPDNLAVAYREGSQRQLCGLGLSSDNGRTWKAQAFVGLKGRFQFPEGFAICEEATTAFGPDGTLYYLFQSERGGLGGGYSELFLSMSTDGGASFSNPHNVDRNPPVFRASADFYTRLAVDGSGRLHLTWTRYATPDGTSYPGVVMAASSSDRGATFSVPVNVSPAKQKYAFGSTVSIGGDGAVYVLWMDATEFLVTSGAAKNSGACDGSKNRAAGCTAPGVLDAAVSRDGGATYSAPAPVDAAVNMGCPGYDVSGTGRAFCDRLHYQLVTGWYSLAAAPSPGVAYAAWWDGDPQGPARLSLSLTRDGGGTWSKRRAIGMLPGKPGDQQVRPTLAVAPDGRLDVAYYDVAAGGKQQDVYTMSSRDGGATFSAPVRVTDVPSDTGVGPLTSDGGGVGFGEWLGLASTDDAVSLAWTDSRRGTADSGKQDIFVSGIQLLPRKAAGSSGGQSDWALRAGIAGASVLVLGSLLLLVRRARRGPGRPR